MLEREEETGDSDTKKVEDLIISINQHNKRKRRKSDADNRGINATDYEELGAHGYANEVEPRVFVDESGYVFFQCAATSFYLCATLTLDSAARPADAVTHPHHI